MDPHFLRNVQDSHRTECQDYWGPKFVLNVQAITAYGEVILNANSEAEYVSTMLRRVYDGRGGAIPVGEESVCALVDRGAKLYLETLNQSGEALEKLSNSTKTLAEARGPLGMLADLIRETTYGAILDDIVSEQTNVARLLSSAKQEIETLKTLWTALKSFLETAGRTIGEKKFDLATSIKYKTSQYEALNDTIIRKQQLLKELSERLYQQQQIVNANTPGFWGPSQEYIEAHAQVNLILPQTVRAEQAISQAQAEAKKLKTEKAALLIIASKLEMLNSPLNRAFATVDTTLSAYRSLLERVIEIDTKEGRLTSYLRRLKEPQNLGGDGIGFARANAFKMIIEMRLTLNVIFEWSSQYVRVSRELLLPAFNEIYGGGSFDTVLKNHSIADMTNFRQRVQKSIGRLPYDGLPLATRESARLEAIGLTPAPETEFFTGSLKNATTGMAYLRKISAFAELEVEKLYNNAQQDAVNRVRSTVEEVYMSTVRATPKQFRIVQAEIEKDRYDTMPAPRMPIWRQVLPVEEKITMTSAIQGVDVPPPPPPPLPKKKKKGLLGWR